MDSLIDRLDWNHHCVVCKDALCRRLYEVCYRCEHDIKAIRAGRQPNFDGLITLYEHFKKHEAAMRAYTGDFRVEYLLPAPIVTHVL